MKNPLRVFRKLRFRSQKERRQHPRHACRISVHYLVQGSCYGGSIQNISHGGVYVRSSQRRKFPKGEPILMVVDLRVLRDQIRGMIIRVGSDGFGVAFHTSEREYTELKALLAAHCLF
jgi:hypothetical protein